LTDRGNHRFFGIKAPVDQCGASRTMRRFAKRVVVDLARAPMAASRPPCAAGPGLLRQPAAATGPVRPPRTSASA
jgi:hypothetical protein